MLVALFFLLVRISLLFSVFICIHLIGMSMLKPVFIIIYINKNLPFYFILAFELISSYGQKGIKCLLKQKLNHMEYKIPATSRNEGNMYYAKLCLVNTYHNQLKTTGYINNIQHNVQHKDKTLSLSVKKIIVKSLKALSLVTHSMTSLGTQQSQLASKNVSNFWPFPNLLCSCRVFIFKRPMKGH